MAKLLPDAVLDKIPEEIATGTLLCVCSTQPTTYTEASSTYKLADVALTAGDGNGDFTIANGDTNGRKVTLSEQADITVDSNGTPAHIAICISGSSTLLYVTTCTSSAVTTSDTVTVPSFDLLEVADMS